ncbi:MAG: energy transducer TonB [Bacteroidia bacterium]
MKREFIFTNKWLDLMFENRNRAYGAYILRKRQPDYIIAGYFTSVTVILALIFIVYKFSNVKISAIKEVIVTPVLIEKLFTTEVLPKPPAKSESTDRNSPKPDKPNQNTVPVVIDDNTEKKDVDKKNFISDSLTVTTRLSDSNYVETNSLKGETKSIPVDPTAVSVEKMPEFPGGDEALFKFLQKNTHYPPLYRDEKISGTILLSFVVDANGKVTDIKTVRNNDGYPDFSQAAIKAISKMPDWVPGRQNGINVPVIYRLPIKFSIR